MISDIGVLSDSRRFYCEPDDFTQKHLFYAPHAGEYHCSRDYEVSRVYLDVCQIILVDAGELIVEYRDECKTAHTGMIVLLDCREPHRYYAGSDDLKMRWFHFAGNHSQAYTDLLLNSQGFLISFADLIPEVEECCERVIKLSGKTEPSPHIASVSLHRLLALLAITSKQKNKSALEMSIDDTAEYMNQNYAEKEITTEKLAGLAALSPYYYIKKFKMYYEMTPHQYLLSARLKAAKEQLTTTARSIEEIGDHCGFCNTSHFILAFRKNTDMTPLKYRSLWR